MGDNKDSTGLVLLGILVGVIALTLLSRRTQTLSSQHIQQPANQHLDWQPIDIPRVDDIKPVQVKIQSEQLIQVHPLTDSPFIQMVTQLQKTTSQLEQVTSKLQDTMSRLQQSRQSQQNRPPSQPQPIIIQPAHIYQQNQHQPTHIDTQPIQEYLQQAQQQQDNSQQISNTVYKNNEQWEIKRGVDGRIKSLNIIRDVKKNN